MFLLAFLIYSGESSKQRMSLTDSEKITVHFSHASIERELNSAITDLQYLTDVAASKPFPEIVSIFYSFATKKKTYDQIRFISIDGQEKVRVNFRDGKVYIVPKEGLQSKKNRYYFQYSARLKSGEAFISPLDLNMERSIVERPLKPMIRLGMVVLNEKGEKQGVVILNYLASDMLKRFREHANDAAGTFRLLNRNGFWLSHEQWEKEWGFMLERDDTIQNEYPNEWQRVLDSETGQFDTENGLFTFTTVHPVQLDTSSTREDYFWKIVSHVPQKVIDIRQFRQLRLVVLVAGPIYFIMLVLCGWLAYSRVERLKVVQELRQSEARNRAIIDMSLDAIITTDSQGRVEAWNPAAEAMFGYKPKEAFGEKVSDLIIPDNVHAQHAEALNRFALAGQEGVIGARRERIAHRKDNSVFSVDIAVAAQGIAGDHMLTAFIQDLTERKKTEERDRLTKAVFDETLEGISVCDANYKVIMVNKAFTRITGYRLRDVLGKDPNVLDSGKSDPNFFKTMWGSIIENGYWTGEVWNRHSDGHEFPIRTAISAVKDRQGKVQNYIAVFNDITEEKAAEEVIRKQAHYDALTELPNRFLFMDRLDRAVVEAKRTGEVFALLFIDLDRFKAINDNHGHQAGDDLLIEVAKRLNAGVRDSDTVARLAGDEFTIISRNLNGEDDLQSVLNKVKESLCGMWHYDGLEIIISGSVGHALFPQGGDNATALLHTADVAMYKAKQSK